MLLMPVKSFCQQFAYSAKLSNITENRFYSISIQPALSAHLDASLKDLRIINNHGTAVPYIINSTLPALKGHNFQALPITENSVKDSGRSHLVLENTSKQDIDGIALVIRNATVSRMAKISGSDDGKSWFTIIENFNFTGGQFSDSTSFILNLQIPKSNYRFFRIIIDNLKNDPLNIIEAGTYSAAAYSNWLMTSSTTNLLSFVNPEPQFFQKDSSDGYSYIRVVQQAPYHINTISIEVKSPRFYRRNMQVIVGNYSYDFLLIASEQYSLPRFAAKEFIIRVFNGDNPPLLISGITTYQEKKQVIAYLEAGQQYSLLMGNASVEAPVYDLEHFRDSIANVYPLNYEPVQANIQSISNRKSNNDLTLWSIIIGVLALLSFFTWNLTRELKRRNN